MSWTGLYSKNNLLTIKIRTKMAKNKEQQIVAQSSLKTVVEFAQANDYKLTLKDLLGISMVVCEFVETGWSKELAQRVDKIDDYLTNRK
jgi:hypothetical protein